MSEWNVIHENVHTKQRVRERGGGGGGSHTDRLVIITKGVCGLSLPDINNSTGMRYSCRVQKSLEFPEL